VPGQQFAPLEGLNFTHISPHGFPPSVECSFPYLCYICIVYVSRAGLSAWRTWKLVRFGLVWFCVTISANVLENCNEL